jgi:hypothetical protein
MTGDERDDDSTSDGEEGPFIPDSDAGATDADSVSRDQAEEGHEELKNP